MTLKYSAKGKNPSGGMRQSLLNVIAGSARGIKLVMPPGEGVRPTIGRAREAVFASIGDISGLTFWDLFAGSGANGCEAASRGAATVVFVEKEKRHCACIEENISRITKAGSTCETLLLQKSAEFICSGDVPAPDIIFADPPYAESAEWFGRILPEIAEKFPRCCIIWEVPDHPGAPGEILDKGAGEYGFLLKILGGTRFFIKNLNFRQYL